MLKDLLAQYAGLDSIEPINTLLSQHIANWIEHDRPHITVTTYNQYINILNIHLIPYFDPRGITVGKVTPGDLEDYYNFKVAQGLSPNTVIKHHAVIRSSLQWAMKHQYIRYNPADLATKPSKVRYTANEPYSVEEIVQLLTLTQNEPIAVPIFLASFYGLRRSEVLGLRWSSIDFVNGWLHIATTVVKEKIGDNVVSTVRDNVTKTESSRRSLPLCPYTYNYLCYLRQRQLDQMQLCGTSYCQEYLDFVCVDEMGMLLQPDFVSQKFQKLLVKYGLRPIRFHDLRHSCATIMLYLGYTMKDIQTWLGHSNYSFTANVYVHSSKNSHMQMAQSFSENLPALGPSMSESEILV
jgi:integrase